MNEELQNEDKADPSNMEGWGSWAGQGVIDKNLS